MDFRCKRVFIVGGGFSQYAGLPLTSDFTRALFAARHPDKGRSGALVQYLEKFGSRTFGTTPENPSHWPALEDLFTCVDLAANSGHHLGNAYSPADLRTVRRSLIARIIRMLHNGQYKKRSKADREKRRPLEEFLRAVDCVSSAFLSMNWDELIEANFLSARPRKGRTVDYGCDAIRVRASRNRLALTPVKATGPTLHITKIHGSVNWLYCDNCLRILWLKPGSGLSISKRLLSDPEWEQISPSKREPRPWNCPFCKNVRLSTRLATFSYRKALDFPMFQKSWFAAESQLRTANTWAFIGYSLPPADYEFKYLLKRTQLSRRKPPRLVLVTGGSGATATYDSYRRFFGEGCLRTNKNCFLKGLDERSTSCLLNY